MILFIKTKLLIIILIISIIIDNLPTMNIQQFQYVLAVVDSKNFQEAAERCCVTQSTLSTMINKLENEISIELFNRKTKPVTVTLEGQKIINRLRVIVNEIAQLENVVQEIKGDMIGSLTIGIIPTIAPYLLPLFIQEFARQFPKVNIQIKEMTTQHIKQNLLLRSLDIGILALPLAHKELMEVPLYNEPFLVYDCTGNQSKQHVSPKDLDYTKICLLEEGHCLRTQVYDICKLSEKQNDSAINFKFESGSMESLLRITESRKGITIIPFLAYHHLAKTTQNNIISFKQPVPVRSVGLVTNHFFVKKALKDALIKIIKKSTRPLIAEVDKSKVINPV